ncbi:lysoplasmalogenase family protein [Phaeovulum sp.]|uniref:lysoplasmalogenase family protein n=1 Tax=Phaeovulum sp. TaxID=2934796 RepID=UPI0039E30870
MSDNILVISLFSAALLAALAMAFHYCVQDPSAAKSVIKTTSVAMLALIGVVIDAPMLVILGLGLGALGDYFLSRPGQRAFLAGMGAFGAGHLAYVAAFVGAGAALPPFWPALALIGLGLSTESWLAPRTGSLRLAVRAYVLIILAMALAALGLPPRLGQIRAGALAFLLSDLVLALEIFVLSDGPLRRAAKYLLWALYWLGQVLILFGSVA